MGWLCLCSNGGLQQNHSAVVVGRRRNNGDQWAQIMPTEAKFYEYGVDDFGILTHHKN